MFNNLKEAISDAFYDVFVKDWPATLRIIIISFIAGLIYGYLTR